MAGEVKKVIQLEIGHVLFIDTVGYSKFQGSFLEQAHQRWDDEVNRLLHSGD